MDLFTPLSSRSMSLRSTMLSHTAHVKNQTFRGSPDVLLSKEIFEGSADVLVRKGIFNASVERFLGKGTSRRSTEALKRDGPFRILLVGLGREGISRGSLPGSLGGRVTGRKGCFCRASAGNGTAESAELAVIFDVEGVFADVHRYGHREAFNSAFRQLDLDCANWTDPVYADLRRRGRGNEERMLFQFFDQIGWPLAVPTNEKDKFVRVCLRLKGEALKELIAADKVPIRPGFEEFLSGLRAPGIKLVALAAESNIGEENTRKLISLLGSDLASGIVIVGKSEVSMSAYTRVTSASGVKGSGPEQLALELNKAVAAEKQRIAEQVSDRLDVSVELDTASGSDAEVAAIQAAVELAEVPKERCVLIAGSHSLVQAAGRANVPCVVIKSSITSRAEFPGALCTYEDFGPGSGMTIAKLQRLIST